MAANTSTSSAHRGRSFSVMHIRRSWPRSKPQLARDVVRCVVATGDRACRAHRRGLSRRRASAVRVVGDRSCRERGTTGARRYRTRADRQVHGLLSRPHRLPAGQCTFEPRHVRQPVVRRRAGGLRGGDARAAARRRGTRGSAVYGRDRANRNRAVGDRAREQRLARHSGGTFSPSCARSAHRHGALLIFDEVTSGFGSAPVALQSTTGSRPTSRRSVPSSAAGYRSARSRDRARS